MGQKRLALVTGASSGIGEAFARRLAERGDDLVLVARNGGRLHALADELKGHYGTATEVIAADLTDPDQLVIVEKRLGDDQHPVDILVNNAGFGTSGDFATLPIEGEVNELDLNIAALVRLSHAALGSMIERRSGAILNVASVAAFQPAPRSATYAATKAFVLSFSESLHEEVKGAGIKVSCLCPGFTHSNFHARADIDKEIVPGPLWLTADAVARAGIAGLDRNVAVVVPGSVYKATAVATRMFPRTVVRKVASAVTRRY